MLRKTLRAPFVTIKYATPQDSSAKTYIVTGAGHGSLGYATAKQIAQWGGNVIVTTRSNTNDTVNELISDTGGNVSGHNLDLASTSSVKAFAGWFLTTHGERLDCLINNAGIHLDLMSDWKTPKLTDDGAEIHWRTNFLGTAHLTELLLPALLKTGSVHGDARLVNVVSQLHSRGRNDDLFNSDAHYESWQAYGRSKLALMHLARALHEQYSASHNLKTYDLHPGGKGGTYTNVASKGLEGHNAILWFRKLAAPIEKLLMATTSEGAQTQIHCATSPGADSNYYWVNGEIATPSVELADKSTRQRVKAETRRWLDTVVS